MNKIFYHGSPTQNIKSFNSNSFITPNKSFAACYGVLWSDGEAYQINHNGRIYFAIEDESKLSNSCSLYSIKVDPRLIKKYNSDEYILSTRKYNILDEYQYSSFQKMLETNGVILLTMDVFKSKFHKYIKESYGIFESVEFLNESKYGDHIFQIAKEMSMIKYGAFDKNGNELSDKRIMDVVVQDPEDTLKRGKGICMDQVEVERLLFTKAGIPHKIYYVGFKDDEGDDVAHVFLVFEDGKEFKWFENSWSSCKGIHSYKSLNDLLHDIAERHCDRENINNCKIFEIDESLIGMTQDEVIKLANSKTNIFSK